MKKIMFCFVCLIIWSLICVFGGYLISKKLIKPVTITKYETQWKDRVVYRDISSMTEEEKDKELKCYYQSEFKLDINSDIHDGNKYRITGSLCERSSYKDIEIECSSSGNWKLYTGIGTAGVISGFALYHLGR